MTFVGKRLSIADPGAIACTIYLLAQAHSADLAAAAGWHALELGCDDDQVIIALADVLQVQTSPRQTAPVMMRQRSLEHRSAAFLIKLADHYRTSGQGFLAEDFLRGLVRRGRNDLVLRLAEHWFESQDWRSARELLRRLALDQMTPYTVYLTGRCSVSLLLEDEVVEAVEILLTLPDVGRSYAALLQCVWAWRVGDPAAAARSCPDGEFPPLMTRDAAALRAATVAPLTIPPRTSAGVWRDIGARGNLPNILGIGMQRTATTWLWKQLRKHPDVQARTFKELAFFSGHFDSPNRPGSDLRDAVLGEAGDLYWQGPTRSLQHYRGLFEDTKRFRVDNSPDYAELPAEAVARVRDILGPDVKIILSVRDPVDRSWSNLKYDLTYTGEHPLNFSFAQRTAAFCSAATLRRCDYVSVLETWRRFFTNIKVLFVDDIIARPGDTLADLSRFVGFDSSIGDDCAAPVNITDSIDLPRDDRMFLFGLHQHTYDAAEAVLGGPALGWRSRQRALLDAAAGQMSDKSRADLRTTSNGDNALAYMGDLRDASRKTSDHSHSIVPGGLLVMS